MTRVEQRRMIRELREFAHAMTRDDSETLAMLVKRDKDDEDLDELSVRRLDELTKKYVKKKTKADIEEAWKKLTQSKQPGDTSE